MLAESECPKEILSFLNYLSSTWVFLILQQFSEHLPWRILPFGICSLVLQSMTSRKWPLVAPQCISAFLNFPGPFFFGRTLWLAGSYFPDQGFQPEPPAVEAQSPNHWTTRKFSVLLNTAFRNPHGLTSTAFLNFFFLASSIPFPFL